MLIEKKLLIGKIGLLLGLVLTVVAVMGMINAVSAGDSSMQIFKLFDEEKFTKAEDNTMTLTAFIYTVHNDPRNNISILKYRPVDVFVKYSSRIGGNQKINIDHTGAGVLTINESYTTGPPGNGKVYKVKTKLSPKEYYLTVLKPQLRNDFMK